MQFLESMEKRYTTKMYNKTKKIASEKIEELKEILRLAPSSINSQPWKFVFVQDERMKERLSKVSLFNNEKVLNCDTLVVFCRADNIFKFERGIATRLPQRTNDYYNTYLKPLANDQLRGWFGCQVYLALGVFLSACSAMDIDSTPMEGIEFRKYNDILELEDYSTMFAVAIGIRDDEDFNTLEKVAKSRRDLCDVVQSM